VNVQTCPGFDYKSSSAVRSAVEAAESELTGKGRVLLRPSGTEPVVRVMVEGEDGERVRRLAESIANAMRASTTPAAA